MNIFEYSDYRTLLRDLYTEKKRVCPFFSFRYIGIKLGFSAGFFANVLGGKRNISDQIIFKLAELFRFSKQETEYFELLVHYNQCKEQQRKVYYFEKMVSMRKSTVRELTAEQNEYFSRWYHVAVRELINCVPFKGDYKQLASMLVPKITPLQAQNAVELLLKLGLIRKNGNEFVVTEKTITTGPQVSLSSIHMFQRDTIDIAKTALDRFERNERSISTLTLSISQDMFRMIEEKLASLRRDLLEMVKNEQGALNRVYQLNFQVFPLTKHQDTSNK